MAYATFTSNSRKALPSTINDGESATVSSPANSSTFLEMDGLLYSASKACTTLPKERLFKRIPTLSCYVRERQKDRKRQKLRLDLRWRSTVCLCVSVCFLPPQERMFLPTGLICVLAAYLPVLVNRKGQSQAPGGSMAGEPHAQYRSISEA